ncbi:MAG: endonuclease MutS2 [Bacteroidales bacterium]|nr:endonuclease MutS2 [Bacteroidales bacterium]
MIHPERFEDKVGFTQVRAMVAQKAKSPIAKELVEEMIFSADPTVVRARLEETAEMLAIISGGEDFPLANFRDVTSPLKAIQVEGTYMSSHDLSQLAKSLRAVDEVRKFMSQRENEDAHATKGRLAEKASYLDPFPGLLRSIDRIIDEQGNVKDSASPELATIRQQLSQMSGRINSIIRRVIAKAVGDGYLDSDVTPSVRDGRLVIPVAPMHKRKINGIVHDESASGKTFFIEPAEVVEANNRLRELEVEERHEMIRILQEISRVIRPEIPALLDTQGLMGEFDFIHAKALFAREIEASMPHLVDHPEMEWYHAQHPVLLQSLKAQGKEVVPLDITLTKEKRLLVISGPNAGGKSVCLKTVGVVQYMLQCGILPPLYDNSHAGIFQDIFIDIGDNQSIEDDLSTYSSHLSSMKQCLLKGRSTSLILIDEFGSGTEPQIGGALAQAMLKQFNAKKMWGVVTTHYQNLKQLANELPGLVNGSMLYDRQKMRPLFRLSIGSPGSSFAIEIARKIGLPSAIIDDATEIVGSDYVNLDRYLLDIARDKRYWEHKRDAIKQKEKKIDAVLERYESDATSLREKRREIISQAQDEAKRIIEQSNSQVERTIHDIKRSQAEREATLEARRRLKEEKERLATEMPDEHPLLKKAPKAKKEKQAEPKQPAKELRVGDNVKLDGQGTVGKILEINGKQAVVAFGLLKTTVALDRLEPTLAKVQSGAKAASFVSSATSERLRDRQLQFKPEIDVRGMRADEAIQAVTYFMDDAIQFGQQRVRILHGTGTGALRQAIRQYLDTVRGVASYRDEHPQFGGAGITIVDLS